MSIAIIIGTHGAAAEQLLETTEMILGSQQNVSGINFFPGENLEMLIEKYLANLEKLNIVSGVLFLVDTWGGSPFNAASRIALNKENNEVITGVNIPMLIEIFMAREDNLVFQQLVKIAIEAGRAGIKGLKMHKMEDDIKFKKTSTSIVNVTAENDIHMKNMNIRLARIDDRLIHGQVTTCWTKEINVKRIIVVNDEVAADKVRKTLLTQVAPPGITAHVVDVSKAIRVYKNPKYANDRVMLLFTNPTDVVRLVRGGVPITSVNIGGMAFHKNKIQISNAVSVDEKDIAAFNELNKYGIELEIRKVFSDSPLRIMDLLKKLNS